MGVSKESISKFFFFFSMNSVSKFFFSINSVWMRDVHFPVITIDKCYRHIPHFRLPICSLHSRKVFIRPFAFMWNSDFVPGFQLYVAWYPIGKTVMTSVCCKWLIRSNGSFKNSWTKPIVFRILRRLLLFSFKNSGSRRCFPFRVTDMVTALLPRPCYSRNKKDYWFLMFVFNP